jgi:hypothetical protein
MTTELTSFHYAFKISKTVIFEVDYYRLDSNKFKHFSTSAAQFNHIRSDYNQCGQAQKSLLPQSSLAYKFYKKWDLVHLQDLTAEQHAECLSDLTNLAAHYENLNKTITDDYFSFDALVALSRSHIKKGK